MTTPLAVGIAVIAIGATWATPAVLAALAPERHETAPARATITSGSHRVAFTPPAAWENQPTGDPNELAYTHGDRNVRVRLVNGNAPDPDRAARRLVDALRVRGNKAELDQAPATPATGATIRRCTVNDPDQGTRGSCAIVVDKGGVVTVTTLGRGSSDPASITALLKSLTITREEGAA